MNLILYSKYCIPNTMFLIFIYHKIKIKVPRSQRISKISTWIEYKIWKSVRKENFNFVYSLVSEILIKNFQIYIYTLNSIYINATNIIVFAVEVYLIFYLIFYLVKLVINKISQSCKIQFLPKVVNIGDLLREIFNSNSILVTGSILLETCLK